MPQTHRSNGMTHNPIQPQITNYPMAVSSTSLEMVRLHAASHTHTHTHHSHTPHSSPFLSRSFSFSPQQSIHAHSHSFAHSTSILQWGVIQSSNSQLRKGNNDGHSWSHRKKHQSMQHRHQEGVMEECDCIWWSFHDNRICWAIGPRTRSLSQPIRPSYDPPPGHYINLPKI